MMDIIVRKQQYQARLVATILGSLFFTAVGLALLAPPRGVRIPLVVLEILLAPVSLLPSTGSFLLVPALALGILDPPFADPVPPEVTDDAACW